VLHIVLTPPPPNGGYAYFVLLTHLFFFCPEIDISTAVQSTVVKFCTMVYSYIPDGDIFGASKYETKKWGWLRLVSVNMT